MLLWAPRLARQNLALLKRIDELEEALAVAKAEKGSDVLNFGQKRLAMIQRAHTPRVWGSPGEHSQPILNFRALAGAGARMERLLVKWGVADGDTVKAGNGEPAACFSRTFGGVWSGWSGWSGVFGDLGFVTFGGLRKKPLAHSGNRGLPDFSTSREGKGAGWETEARARPPKLFGFQVSGVRHRSDLGRSIFVGSGRKLRWCDGQG